MRLRVKEPFNSFSHLLGVLLAIPGLVWLLAGGLLYTAGAVVYGIRKPDPLPASFGFHGIFHLFVLGGSATHFVFMLHYVA